MLTDMAQITYYFKNKDKIGGTKLSIEFLKKKMVKRGRVQE